MSLVQTDYDTLKACLDKFARQLPSVEATGKMIVERLRAGKTIFACGNGGSATDSMHLCEELVGRYRGNRRPLPAVSLNTDTSVLT